MSTPTYSQVWRAVWHGIHDTECGPVSRSCGANCSKMPSKPAIAVAVDRVIQLMNKPPIDPNKVFDVIRDVCDAHEDQRTGFVFLWKADSDMEWRFGGALGFGGKLHFHYRSTPPLTVSCYKEDSTTARERMIEDANKRLFELYPEPVL